MYTYLIGWSRLDRWYYGVRTAHVESPEKDLWHVYKTSSDAVRWLSTIIGPPDVVEVRREFTSKDAAYKWEGRVHSRLKVYESKRWLNGVSPDAARRGGNGHRSEDSVPRNMWYKSAELEKRARRDWDNMIQEFERDKARRLEGRLTLREENLIREVEVLDKVRRRKRREHRHSSPAALKPETLTIEDLI